MKNYDSKFIDFSDSWLFFVMIYYCLHTSRGDSNENKNRFGSLSSLTWKYFFAFLPFFQLKILVCSAERSHSFYLCFNYFSWWRNEFSYLCIKIKTVCLSCNWTTVIHDFPFSFFWPEIFGQTWFKNSKLTSSNILSLKAVLTLFVLDEKHPIWADLV